jgi:hypothetical protein
MISYCSMGSMRILVWIEYSGIAAVFFFQSCFDGECRNSTYILMALLVKRIMDMYTISYSVVTMYSSSY